MILRMAHLSNARSEGRSLSLTFTLNSFLETPVVLLEGESYPKYSQFLHTYLNHQVIEAKLCLPGGYFILNVEGAP